MISRRGFIGASAAATVAPRFARANTVVLRAEPVTAQIFPEGEPVTPMLGFNSQTPGPELRLKVGDRLVVDFENRTGDGSAIHWHGIRIDNAMDGVPGLTQPLVQNNEDFRYDFVLPDAGTYWYHAHHRSWEQVARGLYGPLIVEEATPPKVDQDITAIIDDWRLEEDGTLMDGFGNMHDFAHAGRLGNYARVLSSVNTVRLGDRVRLRLINTATARVFPLELSGLAGKVVALDGRPLVAPMPIERMMIAPAQRVDILADVTGPVRFDFPTQDEPYEMGQIAAEGENPSPLGTDILGLPVQQVAHFETDQDLTLTMRGGAMGGRHGGDDVWSFNEHSGLPETPFATFKRNERASITLVNDTNWPHAIHLHGHHFHEVTDDGDLGPLRDTTLLMRGQTRKILCRFDNPGKWLMHCHMLGHQASGMKTWITVA